MKEPRHDDERLSALLAGRLEGPEREELLAHLSTSEEDAEVAINAAAILREMEEEDAEAAAAGGAQPALSPRHDVVPPSVQQRARGWPRKTPRWAVPLVLAGLGVLGFWATQGRISPAPGPLQVAAALSEPERSLPADWVESAPLPGDRGEDDRSAVAAGVYLARLAVSIRAGDATTTTLLAGRAADRYDAGVLRQIQQRAGAPADSLLPLLETATTRLESLYDPDYLRAGAWIEAARLAAEREDAGFFAHRDTRAMLDHIERTTSENPDAQGDIARIRAALSADGGLDWTALETGLNSLLRSVSS